MPLTAIDRPGHGARPSTTTTATSSPTRRRRPLRADRCAHRQEDVLDAAPQGPRRPPRAQPHARDPGQPHAQAVVTARASRRSSSPSGAGRPPTAGADQASAALRAKYEVKAKRLRDQLMTAQAKVDEYGRGGAARSAVDGRQPPRQLPRRPAQHRRDGAPDVPPGGPRPAAGRDAGRRQGGHASSRTRPSWRTPSPTTSAPSTTPWADKAAAVTDGARAARAHGRGPWHRNLAF